MAYLLNLAYLIILAGTSPWLFLRAWRQGKYREGWSQKLFGHAPLRTSDNPCMWLHAVSVGEVNLLAPLLERLTLRYPDWDFVISTTTQTGFQLARAKYGASQVFYCPLDFSWAVKNALRRIRPNVLVLAELELWPNLIHGAARQGIRVAVVNGRLSDRSRRGYLWIQPLIAALLRRISLVAVQSDEHLHRFIELGASPNTVFSTGSLKFDGVELDRHNPHTRRLAALAGIEPSDIVFLAGSTQPVEERLAVDAYRHLSREFPQLRLILAPRHAERFDEAARMLDASRLPWQRRSKLCARSATAKSQILLVDTIGELGAWWGTAHIAFVGGTMGSRGGQNMIEPAAYGAAVAFGPNTQNFRDVVRSMRAAQAAVVVHNGDELTAFVRQCLEQPHYAVELGCTARELVRRHQGAADRTVELISQLIDPNPGIHGRAA